MLLAFFVLTLVIPLTGFLLLGESFESRVADVVRGLSSPAALASAVAGILAADLFLPVPSSVVLTYSGQTLGVFVATLAGTLGLTVSSEIGYWIGRVGGRTANRWLADEDLRGLQGRTHRSALWWIVLTRPIPLIAEAATIGAGLARLSHTAYLLTVVIANAWVCLIFSGLGVLGGEAYQWPVLILSAVVPLGLTWLVKRRPERV